MRNKKGLQFYFRLLISISLLYLLFRKADLGELWQIIKNADLFYMTISVLLTPLLIYLSSWKWQVILRAQDIAVSGWRLFWLYVVGYFFNTVLPTNVGGDVVRAYALGKFTGKSAEAFSSVFIERFTGLTALLLMAVLAFFLALRSLWDVWLSIAMVSSLAGYFLLLFLILQPSVFTWLLARVKLAPLLKILVKLQKFQAATLTIRHKRGALIFAMVNSFAFYIAAVLNVYVSALAFHSQLSLYDAFIITPIVLVITMIPISIGGIGLSEGAYFFTFARLGLGGPLGLSVAFLMRAKALLSGLFGGLYYSTMGFKIDTQNLEPTSPSQRFVGTGDVTGDVNYFSGFEDILRRKKSPLRKYQDIVMGHPGIYKLIKYEMITLFLGPLPGILGYFLRRFFFPVLFKKVGKGTVFGRSVSLRHVHKISLGKNCVVDEYGMLSAQGDASSGIQMGNEVLLGRGTVLATRGGVIELGDFCNIGANCRIGTTSRVVFGKHVLLAANCYIGGAQHRFDRLDIPIMRQGYDSKGGVVIEDDVWLGAGVTVLDGVTIGTGSVIGAGSVVTKDIPPFSIALGVPAKVRASRKPPETVKSAEKVFPE